MRTLSPEGTQGPPFPHYGTSLWVPCVFTQPLPWLEDPRHPHPQPPGATVLHTPLVFSRSCWRSSAWRSAEAAERSSCRHGQGGGGHGAIPSPRCKDPSRDPQGDRQATTCMMVTCAEGRQKCWWVHPAQTGTPILFRVAHSDPGRGLGSGEGLERAGLCPGGGTQPLPKKGSLTLGQQNAQNESP